MSVTRVVVAAWALAVAAGCSAPAAVAPRAEAAELVLDGTAVLVDAMGDESPGTYEMVGCQYCGAGFHQRKGPEPSEWSQLVVTSRPLKLDPRTKGGNNPFDLDERNESRCPEGHTAGLNLVSELFLKRRSLDGSDWCQTDKLFGVRRGLLRPEPRLLISQKLRQLLVSMKAKGFMLEPVHLV